MRHFCTYFDANYMTRGIAMYRSLERHAAPLVLWVLCFDDATFDGLSQLGSESIRPIRLADFEAGDNALLAAKVDRSTVEYYFTCTPSLPLYVLRQDPTIEVITYVDADLLFYSSPDPILADAPTCSVTIIPHGFPDHLRHLEMHGVYNVGLLSFRNDSDGRACLTRWREQCIEWCFDRVEDGRFADQGYLDDWPTALNGVCVIDDPGAGLAPWNFMDRHFDWSLATPEVNGRPLIFYHFQAFKLRWRWLYDLGTSAYGRMPSAQRRWLYGGYLSALESAVAYLEDHGVQPEAPRSRRVARWQLARTGLAVLRGQTMLVVGRRRV